MNEQARSPDEPAPGAQPVRVRGARAADAALIAGFNRSMARETEGRELSAHTVHAGVAAVLTDPGLGFYVVAERGAQVVGALLVTYEWSDWRNARFWWIQSVYVTPAERGRGVYRALHRHVSDRAREAGGVCGLRLYVERHNHAARTAYQATGMRDSGYRLYEQEFSEP